MLREMREGRVSALELVDQHLARLDERNPAINAFVKVFHDEARRTAACPLSGPLAGVPVTIKDSFDIAGEATLCGSRFRLGHAAPEDATAVKRLRQAGAIVIGKTNCPEFLMNYETDNCVTGRTNNPWNLEMTAGGSSGGEAAAIASGMSAGGVGSDGGGSIRWPAHACGICGLKPTPGRVSAAGHEPRITHPGGLLGVAGPMARTVGDLRLLFDVLQGWDAGDPFSAPRGGDDARQGEVRIGLAAFGFDSEILRCAAQAIGGNGFRVEPFEWNGWDEAESLWRFFFFRLNWIFIRELVEGREQQLHGTALEWFAEVRGQPEPTAKEVLLNLAARDRLRARFLEALGRGRFLLTPVAGTAAFPHRKRDFGGQGLLGLFRPLYTFNLLGLPAVVLPFGFENGLPVGVQLVGPPYMEEALLDVAARLEEARGPFPAPPWV